MNKVLTALLSVAFSFAALAQQSIDLGALWQRYEFYAGGISGLRSMNDGAHYTALGKNSIDKFSYETGELVTTLFDANSTTELEAFSGYTLSDNELTALLETDTESIYRRSSRSEVYVADLITGDVKKLQQEKVRYATFSPDGESIAYVLNNNLFVYQRALDVHIQVTTDGTFNSIINGGTDWVYEEEFALVKAFWWSPDSKYIGFFRFDETNVRSFNMDIYGSELYPNPNTFKYP
ncbi:MAG TPA: S9 family peptidase, partial [Cryomorphaceae bacterium]|nr:S9 family peptidase [Cryomorphaceae bacterium]